MTLESETAYGGGPVVKMGSFVKSTAAAPVNQTVAHGLGAVPSLIIFYTFAKLVTTVETTFAFSYGATDGTNQRSVQLAGDDNDSGSSAAGNALCTDNVIDILNPVDLSRVATAQFVSWDANNFTLNWVTNNGDGHDIFFIAFSGINAKVMSLIAPGTTGNTAYTGVGFQPDLVQTIWVQVPDPGATTRGTTANYSPFDMGFFNAALESWTCGPFLYKGTNYWFSNAHLFTGRNIRTAPTSASPDLEATPVSMDPDGFTLNYNTVNTGRASGKHGMVICFKGVEAKLATFSRTAGSVPVDQSMTGIGFQPDLLFLTTHNYSALSYGQIYPAWSFGAADASAAGAGVAKTYSYNIKAFLSFGVEDAGFVYLKLNTGDSTSTLRVKATLQSLDADGFTLRYDPNYNYSDLMAFVALRVTGAPTPPGRKRRWVCFI